MKKLFLFFITGISLLSTGSLIILNSCHKTDNNNDDNSNTVVQGTLNPSFESGSDINADSWGGTYICPGGCCAQATRAAMQGPGFMPTSGTYYMSMQWNTYCDCAPYFYQDNVDLSTSTKLIFDWEYSGLTNTGCGGYTFYVLFSANGTDTLFHQTLSQAAVQKMNDTINLPSLPSPGRLLFTYGGSFGTFCQGTMGIDNIRVL
jgi:hypothetical protein